MDSENNYEIESIIHDGIVKDVDPAKKTVTVLVSDKDECGGCPAARLCSISGEETQTITITTKDALSFKKGDEVEIEGSEQLHRKALTIATVLPCIILVAVMVGVYILTGGNQSAAALAGIGATILFFLILYLARNSIAHEFVMTIRHKGEQR